LFKEAKRNYQNFLAWANPNKVGYIILYVTNRCNFRCEFCFYYSEIEKGGKPDELTVEELEKIAKSTGPLLQLSLTGGEPFLRKEFAEITSIFIENTNVRFITIPTNAWYTDRMVIYLEELLKKFPNTYFRLAFSIDGIGEEHDESRSMPGSYDRILESYRAISPLRKHFANLVLDSNTVFTSKSEQNILNTLHHLNENFQYDNHTVTYVRGDIKDPALKTEDEKLYRELNSYLASIERKKEKRFLYPLYRGVRDLAWENLMETVFEDKFVTPCVGGRKLIVISETGEIYPCEVLGKSMGNLRNYEFDLPQLLAEDSNDKLRNWIVDSKCKCSFECALSANVTWNASMYPKLAKKAIKNFGNGWHKI
jgi:radical SAM protein with 4Fe4S-binding SPASM domain